jgi:4-hydroxy-2-oxoheptanedioate aldolase
MVETALGLENAAAIAAVPGVDAIYVGPVDLALELGLDPAYERDEPEHVEAIERIRQACDAAGIVAGIHCDGGELAVRRCRQGFRMVTVGSDAAWLRTTAAAQLGEVRREVGL